MKGYSKKQGQKLQRKVLQSLLAASVMCVCTFGGDNSAWAADYNSDETLKPANTGNAANWETYDNVIIIKIIVITILMVLRCVRVVLVSN